MRRGNGGLATILTGASPPEGGWVSGKAADLLVSIPISTTVGVGGCVGCGCCVLFSSVPMSSQPARSWQSDLRGAQMHFAS